MSRSTTATLAAASACVMIAMAGAASGEVSGSSCAEPVCDPGAVNRENENTCDLPDTVNGGCAISPFRSTPIAMGDKLCGTIGAVAAIDYDWYGFTLADTRTVAIRARAEHDLVVGLLRRIGPTDTCGSFESVIQPTLTGACQVFETTITLPSGEFHIVMRVGTLGQCGSQYQLELFEPPPCGGPVCPEGAIDREFEPGCGLPVDSTNGGCESLAGGFGFLSEAIALGETVCGTLGVVDSADRDSDYYELTLAHRTQLFIGAISEIPVELSLRSYIDPDNNCLGDQTWALASGTPCDLAQISPVVDAGTYSIRIVPDTDAPAECGRAYTLSVDGVPACAGDSNGDGVTNAGDFTILAGNFGSVVAPNTGGDLNGDGLVNAADFVILAGDFGCGS